VRLIHLKRSPSRAKRIASAKDMRALDFRDGPRFGRRTLLGLALTPLLVGTAGADEEAAKMPPQPDDRFVFLAGPKKGRVVNIDDLPLGGPQMQAFPVSQDGTVRNGTPLNLVILARFDPARLSEETRTRSAAGAVAYSAVCTHQGCAVNMWSKDLDAFVCSCHGSVYDPRNGAEVLAGPAPRPLPSLALKLADGAVAVASTFSGRVGGTQK
jgi:rieske iron-sulfur protein